MQPISEVTMMSTFEVKGHIREYPSGLRVWIDPFAVPREPRPILRTDHIARLQRNRRLTAGLVVAGIALIAAWILYPVAEGAPAIVGGLLVCAAVEVRAQGSRVLDAEWRRAVDRRSAQVGAMVARYRCAR